MVYLRMISELSTRTSKKTKSSFYYLKSTCFKNYLYGWEFLINFFLLLHEHKVWRLNNETDAVIK